MLRRVVAALLHSTVPRINRLSIPLLHSVSNPRVLCTRVKSETHRQRQNASSSNVEHTSSHIIVGAGSAGCVLTNRLSEDAANNVLLLEAGPRDHWWQWKIHMPAALMYNLCNDRYNWYYRTLPQVHMNERVMYWPRGRVWGGSSALNAMAYVRGHAYDYDRWGTEGAEGWSYAACLPYFRRAQSHNLATDNDKYRGANGPLGVTQGAGDNPLHQAWLLAGVQAGYGFTSDMNGYRQEGVAYMDMTVKNGVRSSASRAYLRPALGRSNVSVLSNVLVTRVLFEGRRAIGVEYVNVRRPIRHADGLMQPLGERRRLYTDGKVILAGGAINSPQLLMLSGIGPSDELKSHGIDVRAHMPGVGANLQDHLEIYVQQACTEPITLYDRSSWRFPHKMIKTGLEWFLWRTGDGASSHLETGGFVRSRAHVTHPDVQFHFHPGTVEDHGRKTGTQHAYQVHVGPMRPTSKGWLRLRSPDPREAPLLQPNYLSTEQDRIEFRDCIRIPREIFAQRAFDDYRGDELQPGIKVHANDDIDALVRERADSAYHPSCTCAMGTSDMSVVDGRTMTVHGFDNLHVVDASVMPSIVSGNLNAPTIMLAERAADLIRGRELLPHSDAPVWQAPTNGTNKARGSDVDFYARYE